MTKAEPAEQEIARYMREAERIGYPASREEAVRQLEQRARRRAAAVAKAAEQPAASAVAPTSREKPTKRPPSPAAPCFFGGDPLPAWQYPALENVVQYAESCFSSGGGGDFGGGGATGDW